MFFGSYDYVFMAMVRLERETSYKNYFTSDLEWQGTRNNSPITKFRYERFTMSSNILPPSISDMIGKRMARSRKHVVDTFEQNERFGVLYQEKLNEL